MLILLALPAVVAVAATHRYLRIYAPSNVIVRQALSATPRWRIVAALLAFAAVLLIAVRAVAEEVAAWAPGWLNLVVLVLAWDAIKVVILAVHVGLRVVVRGAVMTSRVARTNCPVR